MLPRADLTLNNPFCLRLLSAKITGMCHHTSLQETLSKICDPMGCALTITEHSHTNVASLAFVKLGIEYLPHLQGTMYSFLRSF